MNKYYSVSRKSFENGTFYRETGRKRDDKYAIYRLGDFIDFTNDLPTGLKTFDHKGNEL